ncbi:hypothetical protein ACQKFL_12310 [Vreelandella titanicae]|uniref:hypothetical protein n=1 Tax=Vreelandella titanicae TaxID=664683 RepID=UPI003CFF7864|tara:strand:+ start:2988 stop:3287 length:300 start_codon:yes stop_codon:yes gene_type:complete
MRIYFLLIMCLIRGVTKPPKKVLILAKFWHKTLAIQIAVLFSSISPMLYGAALEVISGEVPLGAAALLAAYLAAIAYAGHQFWRVADGCTIQLRERFGA